MAQQSIKKSLEKLGLSQADAGVYLSVIDNAPCTASPIIRDTGLHRNVVYTSLAHLVSRKLVSEVNRRGKKHFSATDPQILITAHEQQLATAQQVTDVLQARIANDVRDVTIHEGNDEYLTLLTTLIRELPKGGTKYVIGTGGAMFMEETMLPIWEEYHKTAHAQHISIKMIGYEPQRDAISPHTDKERIYDVRYLADEAKNPSGLHIYPEANTVLNIIYTDSIKPVTAVKIKDSALVEGYLHMFDNLWGSAST